MGTELSRFEGHDVVGTTIQITKAGDGLSAALKIDPVEYEHGERVHVVLDGVIGKVQFVPSKDNPDALIRVHTLEAETVTVVDGSKVKSVLNAQRKKFEEAEGINRLPGIDEDDAA